MRILTLLMLFATHAPSGADLLPGDDRVAAIDYPGALVVYDSLLTVTPDDPRLLWRLSRLYVMMGDMQPRDERERFYRTAETFARKCIAADSLVGEGHTGLAAALGNIAMFEGSKTKVRLANDIKQELDIALALNPDDDIALSILGTFYRQLGNISWIERQLANIFLGSLPDGGYDDAEAALKKAIAINPRFIRHRFELGMLYRDTDREEEAKEVFRTALALPVTVASDERTKQRMRRFLDGD